MKQGKAGLSDEYARIYNEMSAMNGIYATENMAMYTLTITVIGFGWEFESPFLLLLSFAILIPFQILLGGHLSTFLRNGAYLMVFHEADNVKSLEKNLDRAYHKFKQYPPLSDDEILDYNVMLQDLIKELGISSPSATGIPHQSEKQKPVEIK